MSNHNFPRFNWVRLGLWVVMLLTLVSSMSHLAAAFGSLEDVGNEWRGWLPAIAIDAGLLAATYAIQQRKVAKRGARLLWLGVILFVAISSFANIDHAMTVAATTNKVLLATFDSMDGWQLAKVILLAGLLPVLVFLVAEVTSDTATNKPQPGDKLATIPPEIGDNSTTDNLPIVTVERPTTDNYNLPTRQPQVANSTTDEGVVAVDNSQPQPVTLLANWLQDLRLPTKPQVAVSATQPQPATRKIATRKLPKSQPNDKPQVAKPATRAPRQLDEELRQAVLLYKQYGSFAKASTAAGVSGETIRKRVAAAREQAPEWVGSQLDN